MKKVYCNPTTELTLLEAACSVLNSVSSNGPGTSDTTNPGSGEAGVAIRRR